MTKLTILGIVLGVAALWAMPVSVQWSPTPQLSLDRAEARVGRPLTPMSVAGVNRRWHRRAYYGAALGAAAVGGYYYNNYYDRYNCGNYGTPPCY